MAEGVRQDDEILLRIQGLTLAEQLSGEIGRQHAGPGPARAVQDHDRLAGRLPDGPVVQAHFRQDVAGMEPEVLGDEGAFLGRRVFCRTGIGGEDGKRQRRSGGGMHQRSQDPHGASSLIFL